jgi:hypothetical protein
MSPLPPFVAKLIASDGYEEKKYFETQAAAQSWALGEGKDSFDGDIERAEIHHPSKGLVWFKDRPKIDPDWRTRQMRGDPTSPMNFYGLPKPKPKPDIEAFCDNCQHMTMNWREYEKRYGFFPLKNKPLLRCSECYKVVPDNNSQRP